MSIIVKLQQTLYISWLGIGYYRGTIYYNNILEKNKYNKMYTDMFIYGCISSLLYACPLSWPFTLYNEIINIELNIRKLHTKVYYK